MCEQSRSYTPGKSFVQILLLPALFGAFIPSPRILAGQAASRSKTENVEEPFALEGAENAHVSPCCVQELELGGSCIWSGLIIPVCSLLLGSTSKERLFGFLCACKT